MMEEDMLNNNPQQQLQPPLQQNNQQQLQPPLQQNNQQQLQPPLQQNNQQLQPPLQQNINQDVNSNINSELNMELINHLNDNVEQFNIILEELSLRTQVNNKHKYLQLEINKSADEYLYKFKEIDNIVGIKLISYSLPDNHII